MINKTENKKSPQRFVSHKDVMGPSNPVLSFCDFPQIDMPGNDTVILTMHTHMSMTAKKEKEIETKT